MLFFLSGSGLLHSNQVESFTPAAGGFSIGIGAGIHPDVYRMSEYGEKLADQNTRLYNRIEEINRIYDSSTYGEALVVRDFKYQSNEINAVPVEFSLRYSWYGLLFRMGFVYYNIPVDQKSYVLTAGAATSRKFTSSSGSATLYHDIDNNFDSDFSNDEPVATGLRPTYGEPVRFTQSIRAERFEIPVTFGISMFDLGPASFYFGGGFTFYRGMYTRVIHADPLNSDSVNAKNFIDDVDRFSGEHVGFHIMTSAEYRFIDRVGVFVEFTLNYGSTDPLLDSTISGAFTNNSLFHTNEMGDFGGTERSEDIKTEKETGGAEGRQIGYGRERTGTLDFTGFRIMTGLTYRITVENNRDKQTAGYNQ